MSAYRPFIFYLALAFILLTNLILAGCSTGPKEVGPGNTASTSPAAGLPASTPSSATVVAHGPSTPAPGLGPASGSRAGSAAGLKWTAPARWEVGPERQMRAATYLIPPASGESEGAECGVFYFGPGQGGDVEANIKRWIGQFEQPDGKPSEERAKEKKETINGLAVTTVDLTGTYLGGGPMMGQGQGKKTGYRLLGAIVEAPEGAIFFKLTGPAKTVAAAQGEFQNLLKSLGKT